MNIIKLSGAFALSLGFACGGSQSTPQNSNHAASGTHAHSQEQLPEQAEQKDIVETAIGANQFTTLVAALEAADLVGALQGDGPFTVFAPTDAAFAKLPAGTVEALLKDKEKLSAILTYHVVSGKVMAADVAGLSSAPTLLGKSVAIDTSNGVRINDSNVISADIVASNGVIHVIDTVLIPN